ncbi:hypothetical protein L1987_83590 [Smallanthus sonchifolius]|uniref:Uncharacterized protein n=1 Tax=Smallanthus sonchifolius TaxID=185202 RepID=A0ACB8YGK1_9ASTR|nr:hypothetical protein L1987_83590 [Smallanthus sonchifolius]
MSANGPFRLFGDNKPELRFSFVDDSPEKPPIPLPLLPPCLEVLPSQQVLSCEIVCAGLLLLLLICYVSHLDPFAMNKLPWNGAT